MNSLDTRVVEDLANLPGWEELAHSPAPTLSPEALLRSTVAVRDAIAADAPRTMSGNNTMGVRGNAAQLRRARWGIAAIAAVAAAALVMVTPTISTPGNPPVSVASATEFLTHLANTATAAPGLDADYWKVRFVTTYQTDPPDGSGDATTMWYGRQGGRWITSGDGTVVKASDTRLPFVIGARLALSWRQVVGLSADPGQLERDLRSTLGRTSVATGAARLLAIAPLSAAQRSALFTILARQSDVTIQEGVRSSAGRIGTALSFPFGPTETPSELLTMLLTDNGTLLEVTEAAVRDQRIPSGSGAAQITKKGDIISRTTYLEVGGTNAEPGA